MPRLGILAGSNAGFNMEAGRIWKDLMLCSISIAVVIVIHI